MEAGPTSWMLEDARSDVMLRRLCADAAARNILPLEVFVAMEGWTYYGIEERLVLHSQVNHKLHSPIAMV